MPMFKHFSLVVIGAFVTALMGCQTPPSAPSHSLKAEQNHGFTAQKTDQNAWWDTPYPTSFDAKALKYPQSVIKIKGAQFVTDDDKPFIFRGVNIADPFKLMAQQHWNKELFAEIKRWGANTVRIPIHPLSWRQQGETWMHARLDEAVLWANEYQLYLIVDWHSIGNLEAELFQHPMYNTTRLETAQFWRSIALRYKNVPCVAVYEIFNEPTHNYIGTGDYSLGKASWETWRTLLEDYIDLIHVYNKQAIPLVAGFNWAYDLSPVAKAPINRPNIAYAAHPYPQKAKPNPATQQNYFNEWEKTWGYVANQYPIIATELGWAHEKDYGAHVPVIHNEGTYGPNITQYMRSKGISYTAWVFDPDWPPRLIKDWNFTPTESGEFFKQDMLKGN